jgi:hypothetical protein
MATFNKFNSFVEALAEKVHNLGSDTLTVALCAAANAPVATNTQLSNLTQVAYTNLSARTLSNVTSSQTGGTYTLDADDLVLSASGGSVATFRYVVIYNDTATNDELIGWADYGSDVTLADGESFTIKFGASGILTIA